MGEDIEVYRLNLDSLEYKGVTSIEAREGSLRRTILHYRLHQQIIYYTVRVTSKEDDKEFEQPHDMLMTL